MKTTTVFSFWKENKKSGFFQLNEKELIEQFKKWLQTKERAWLEYYGITDCVNAFVSQGLNAIGNVENDFAEYRDMEDILKTVRREHLK